MDINITPVGQDITGQIAKGIITIRGPVVCGKFSAPPEDFKRLIMFSRVLKPHVSYKAEGGIMWDRGPRYEAIFTVLTILKAGSRIYALILEAVHDQT
jgi:hypothetical protein